MRAWQEVTDADLFYELLDKKCVEELPMGLIHEVLLRVLAAQIPIARTADNNFEPAAHYTRFQGRGLRSRH